MRINPFLAIALLFPPGVSGQAILFNKNGTFFLKSESPTIPTKQLTSQSERASLARFSPDGRHVIFRSTSPDTGKIDFFRVPADASSRPERLTDGGIAGYSNDFTFAPDFKTILFAGLQPDGRSSDLYTLDTTTRKLTNLTGTPDICERSPTYLDSEIYYVTDSDGTDDVTRWGSLGVLTDNSTNYWEDINPSPSPNGDIIAYYRWAILGLPYPGGKTGLWFHDVATGRETFISEITVPTLSERATWSPDSRYLAFTAGNDIDSEIRIVDTTTSKILGISRFPGFKYHLSWADSSDKLIFTNYQEFGAALYTLTITPFTHEKLLWSDGCSEASWAPVSTPDEFIRVTGDNTLETAIQDIVLEDGTQVALIGLVHLGDPRYYEKLNRRLKNYDAVLYELLGKGESTVLPPYPKSRKTGFLEKRLDLSRQGSILDYRGSTFIHADLDETELLKFSDTPVEPGNTGLQDILLADQTPASRKDSLLAEPSLLSSLFGTPSDDRSTARHQKLQTVLRKTTGNGTKKIAILYGASHLPAIRNQLPPHKVSATTWLKAW